MTLAGLSGFITSDQIEMVTINGVEQKFKPLSDNTIAVIPAFRQEAQMVKVYCKSTTSERSIQNCIDLSGPIQNWMRLHSSAQNWTQLQPTPPDLSTGLSRATHNRYMKEP